MNEGVRKQNVEALLDAIEDAVLLMERSGRVVLANGAAGRRYSRRHTDRGRDELAGRDLQQLGLSAAALKLWTQWLGRVADLGRPAYFEDEAGDYVHDIAMFPVTTSGHPTRVAVVVRDVTQARRDKADLETARREKAVMADRLESLEKRLKDRGGRGTLLGACPAMEEVFGKLDQAADMDVPVLITGQPGTGKALVAQAIHEAGARAERALERVDCTGVDEAHLESEIFGHVRGALGSGRARKGRLEAADGGTLLLEGVEGLTLRLQLKLRHFLEHSEFVRMGGGGDESISADVRIIASTQMDLVDLVHAKTFREDLAYQLRVMPIPLPPLKDRAEDIGLLAEHFLGHYSIALRKQLHDISAEAMQIMLTHSWPGNVRELRHAMEHATIRCAGAEVLPIHLPPEVVTGPRTGQTGRKAGRDGVLRALEACRWNKTRAARLLGISRGTLYTRMKSFDLLEK